jgi:biopolymer transport protein ExbB
MNGSQTTTTMTLMQFFILGGWAMWPLLIFSIAALAVLIERGFSIFILNNLSLRNIHENVMKHLKRSDIENAKKYCLSNSRKITGASIIHAGLDAAEFGESWIEKTIESEAQRKINTLERGFNILITLGSLAPITGFLGTVSGMINAFDAIGKASEVNAQIVAKGIFEALITTEYGLVIAIAAIAGYNIFAHFVDKFSADIEHTGTEMIKEFKKTAGRIKPELKRAES